MKNLSQRSDVVVVGAGMAGSCASVAAARAGARVALVESSSSLGGRIGRELRFPLEDGSVPNFAYFRETGLLDEILLNDLAKNHEATYQGRERILNEIVRSQDRLMLFTDLSVVEAELNGRNQKILSVTGIDRAGRFRQRFMAPIFIDCTGNGSLSILAGARGEYGAEEGEYEKLSSFWGSEVSSPKSRFAVAVETSGVGRSLPFEVTSWVRLRWEDNESASKLSFIDSFRSQPKGLHVLDWGASFSGDDPPEASEIAYSAWDFLKNRSPIAHLAETYSLSWFSPTPLRSDGFRILGETVLAPAEIESGVHRDNQVALVRAPLDGPEALLSSPIGRIALPGPYGIPITCLYSKKIRNLLVAGEHASGTHRVSACLRHPPTSAQLGEAAGVIAARSSLDRRLPLTLAKRGYVGGIRRALARSNHACGPEPVDDTEDIGPDAEVTASTVLGCCSRVNPLRPAGVSSQDRLLQFPVATKILEEIHLYLQVLEDTHLNIRLLSGATNGSTIPGDCLETISVPLSRGAAQWVGLPFSAKILFPGWHFIEIQGNEDILPYLCENVPVGVLSHVPTPTDRPILRNPYSRYSPVLPTLPGPGSAYCFRLSPEQPVYQPSNIVNGHSRPSRLPNLWISEPTAFCYPEFLELHWPEPVGISSIDIVFDAALEYAYPAHPTSLPRKAISSIVRSYRIYAANEVGHWREVIAVDDNIYGFRSHQFDTITTKAIEIEILSTHGLSRAQVYQVRIYP